MNKPSWLTKEHESGWDNVKAAFSRDWEQTKHDFGSKKAPDLNQDAGDTVRQATAGAAKAANFSDHEPAFRFGYAAQQNYKSKHPSWNNDLDQQLRNDYGADYDRDRDFIRHAYDRKY